MAQCQALLLVLSLFFLLAISAKLYIDTYFFKFFDKRNIHEVYKYIRHKQFLYFLAKKVVTPSNFLGPQYMLNHSTKNSYALKTFF